MRACALLLLLLAAAVAAEPDVTVGLQEFSYGQRIEFVLGNGEHPFADEDQRRAQLSLQVRVGGKAVLLGWSGLEVRAAGDGGDALAVTGMQAEGVFTATRELKDAPSATITGLSLPLTAQALVGLARLDAAVDVLFSTETAETAELAFAAMEVGKDTVLSGVDGGLIAISERSDNRLAFRLNRAAFLALQDLVFRAADGKDLAGRNRRAEWRDGQGVLTYNLKTERIAGVSALVFRRVQSRRASFAATALGLGMAVPGREDLRGQVVRGAGEF